MLLLATTNFWAQSPGFNYKALITNNGTALATQTVDVKFTLIDNTSTAVYEEIHATSTDANGIVSVLLGEGTINLGDFSTIDWTNNFALKVEIDTQDGSGYQNFGTNPFKYVPYAKYAEKAGNVFSGDFGDLNNVPAGLVDGDDDTQLTEAQVDAMVANNGYLTNEVDGDIANELQNLTLQNNTLSITNGNQVVFTDWDTNVNDDVTELNDLSDARTIDHSVYIGIDSGLHDDGSDNRNTAVGYRAMDSITIGSSNVAMGFEALFSNKTHYDNVAIGDRALYKNNQSGNTGLGFNALYFNTNGSRNVAVGRNAGRNNQGSGNVFIGYQAAYNEVGSDKLYIDNSSTSNPLIYGDFSDNYIKINGELHGQDSGDADMKAYIYGNITSTGSIGTGAANSDGFTVTHITAGEYRITFTNSPGGAANYTVLATFNNGFYGFITVHNHDTYFDVNTYRTNGTTAANKEFNFVVYKK